MRATVTHIGQLRSGKKFKFGYYMVKFALETGEFAMSYIGPDFRNWFKWGPVEPGMTYAGVRLFSQANPIIIDADSPVTLDHGPPCVIVSKKKVKPPGPVQGQLL